MVGPKIPLLWLTQGIKNISHACFHHTLYKKRATMADSSPSAAGIPMTAFNKHTFHLPWTLPLSLHDLRYIVIFSFTAFPHRIATIIDTWIWSICLDLPSSLLKLPLNQNTNFTNWGSYLYHCNANCIITIFCHRTSRHFVCSIRKRGTHNTR